MKNHESSSAETAPKPSRRKRVAAAAGGVVLSATAAGIIMLPKGGESTEPTSPRLTVQEAVPLPELDVHREIVAEKLIESCEIKGVRLTGEKRQRPTSLSRVVEVEIDGKINQALLEKDQHEKRTDRDPIKLSMNLAQLDGQDFIAGSSINWKEESDSPTRVAGTAEASPNTLVLDRRMKQNAVYEVFEGFKISSTNEAGQYITTTSKKFCGSIRFTRDADGELHAVKDPQPQYEPGTTIVATQSGEQGANEASVQRVIPPSE